MPKASKKRKKSPVKKASSKKRGEKQVAEMTDAQILAVVRRVQARVLPIVKIALAKVRKELADKKKEVRHPSAKQLDAMAKRVHKRVMTAIDEDIERSNNN